MAARKRPHISSGHEGKVPTHRPPAQPNVPPLNPNQPNVPQPGLRRWHPESTNNRPYPNNVLKQTLARGFDVEQTPKLDPGDTKDWTVRLINPSAEVINLFVYELEVSFEMAGNQGQSRTLRQFFPHNFVQPNIILRGQAPNQYEYNRLALYIRNAHWKALFQNKTSDSNPHNYRHLTDGTPLLTTTLQVIGGGMEGTAHHKGLHKGWSVEGYVKTIQAGARKFENVPEYQFEFVVAQSWTGLWSDGDAILGSQILDWMSIFKNRFQGGDPGVVTVAEVQQIYNANKSAATANQGTVN